MDYISKKTDKKKIFKKSKISKSFFNNKRNNLIGNSFNFNKKNFQNNQNSNLNIENDTHFDNILYGENNPLNTIEK